MSERKPLYVIKTGKEGGSGSFLCPPGHPALTHSVWGYWGGRRKAHPDMISGIEFLLEDPYGDVPPELKARAQKIFADAEQNASEEWIRHTYGYFAYSYSPDGKNRNVSDAVSWHGTEHHKCVCGAKFDNDPALIGHIAGSRKGKEGAVLRLAEIKHHRAGGGKPQPDEHHLGYLMVKQFFPGHQPRTDLIKVPEGLYGTRECGKCHERVQYEARWDRWAKFGSGPACPQGGDHEVPEPEHEAERAAIRAQAEHGHEGTCASCGCEKGQS